MREIKFRFWSIKNKEMISNEVINLDHAYRYLTNINNEHDYIIPMQYTGLKDKNSVEIYEGDIVKHENESIVFVEFEEGSFYLGFSHKCCIRHYDIEEYEVIGNIHENPELLN